jgi:hypothetical protein
VQNFIFKQTTNTFFESDYNDYGLRCEITVLGEEKYKVELITYDCEVVRWFTCKTTDECKSEAYEEAKFLKEMNETTCGNLSVDDYELHHSWCYADSLDIERLKEICSKYDDNKHKCELESAYEYVEEYKTLDKKIRGEKWQADFEKVLSSKNIKEMKVKAYKMIQDDKKINN